MERTAAAPSDRQATRMAVYGAVTLIIYVCLFVMERPILEWSSRGGWYFLVPVAIAFALSFVHGAFTGHFWDVLGIKARK
jgi:hypothetical protein